MFSAVLLVRNSKLSTPFFSLKNFNRGFCPHEMTLFAIDLTILTDFSIRCFLHFGSFRLNGDLDQTHTPVERLVFYPQFLLKKICLLNCFTRSEKQSSSYFFGVSLKVTVHTIGSMKIFKNKISFVSNRC